mmetsp:Transcript_68060/g.149438  ORF Transcript_68060/g.149438 Transcript_68060/m.149438 type:complete len:206 (+) Transcript_68060:176-793(+)
MRPPKQHLPQDHRRSPAQCHSQGRPSSRRIRRHQVRKRRRILICHRQVIRTIPHRGIRIIRPRDIPMRRQATPLHMGTTRRPTAIRRHIIRRQATPTRPLAPTRRRVRRVHRRRAPLERQRRHQRRPDRDLEEPKMAVVVVAVVVAAWAMNATHVGRQGIWPEIAPTRARPASGKCVETSGGANVNAAISAATRTASDRRIWTAE